LFPIYDSPREVVFTTAAQNKNAKMPTSAQFAQNEVDFLLRRILPTGLFRTAIEVEMAVEITREYQCKWQPSLDPKRAHRRHFHTSKSPFPDAKNVFPNPKMRVSARIRRTQLSDTIRFGSR
jgi:hypothetical protein